MTLPTLASLSELETYLPNITLNAPQAQLLLDIASDAIRTGGS